MSTKKLISKFNTVQYKKFMLNNDKKLTLPQLSSVPGIGVSKRKNVYKKNISHPDSTQHIAFITKNNEPHGFLWRTTPQQIKKAVRWGIINTQSITGKAISALGNYRTVAHKRIAKGMMSNSQAVKLKLLDIYQERFEALQTIESLVNKDNNAEVLKQALNTYIDELQKIQTNLHLYFQEITHKAGLDETTLKQIEQDLTADIERTNTYLSSLNTPNNLHAHNRARGTESLMEFVKQQMIRGLYELQGINQDLTYNTKRHFALTRGELNDFIEDARKEIEDHEADLRNAVTNKHHGLFAEGPDALVTYDFSSSHLSGDKEREILLAISFIEGWDKVDYQACTVSNESGVEKLDVIHATRWKSHRNFKSFIKSTGYYLFNIVKGAFVQILPWEEETWLNSNFHLVASHLRKNTRLNEPMWQKPVNLFSRMGNAFVDLFKGVRNAGSQITFKLPDHINYDWESCNDLKPLAELLNETEKEFKTIKEEERNLLTESLRLCDAHPQKQSPALNNNTLATTEYNLTTIEQNDILTAIARSLNEFGSVFSHNVYAKDPIAGLLFTAGFSVGAAVIYLPGVATSIFGSTYVKWLTSYSYSLASSKFAATMVGGSTHAQILATAWDTGMHGPDGIAAKALYHLGEDPLTAGAYFVSAAALGYLLVNGIAGYSIPWLSALLKEDLGTSPASAYPILGAKFAVLLFKFLSSPTDDPVREITVKPELVALAQSLNALNPKQRKLLNRYLLSVWLASNAENLPKLNATQLFDLSRHIDAFFDKAQSKSLKRLLYPESQRSIAFQLFSIPLTYIPAVVRFLVSIVLTVIAHGTNKKHPFEPIKRAGSHLLDKITRDLSRPILFASHMLSLIYTGFSMLIKASSYTLAMVIGRVAGLLDLKPAHAIHKGFAWVHTFFRNIGEFLFPVKAIKHNTIAHPAHTFYEIEGSYKNLLTQMSDATISVKGDKQAPNEPVHAANPLDNQSLIIEPNQVINNETPSIKI